MVNCIADKSFADDKILLNGVHVYKFENKKEKCIVLWMYPAKEEMISINSAIPELSGLEIEVKNLFGEKINIKNNDIVIMGKPVFIIAKNK